MRIAGWAADFKAIWQSRIVHCSDVFIVGILGSLAVQSPTAKLFAHCYGSGGRNDANARRNERTRENHLGSDSTFFALVEVRKDRQRQHR